ncbi:malto-oligosyltrehalose trehalohydrolase [Microvirga massiliensis]|uniref:malto-oligosyltrehalose trehalohydrolase n=1 Tax=Microvirga massiliensis TaxID=1033741 RepID=UPI00062B8513|nr:malto-oligosyltrehalose trehalohydrolase [Microvirga massiliensis]
MLRRRYPIGAEPTENGTSFRVWAPSRDTVAVVLEDGTEHPLDREPTGHFSGVVPNARTGTPYRFRLDTDETLYPDPASRFQPDGPHGPSQVLDSTRYAWRDGNWRGAKLQGQVIYEMHVGTFTPEGTWTAAIDKLPNLKGIGITLIEMMPVNDFPGRFGWGYDGVDLFAPTGRYGSPDDLRAFVDAAHQFGIGVILDVVYNHFGPDGNYLAQFTPDYFTDRYENEWGAAINFDGPNAEGVREFFISNARYWIDEFHFDGLRLDATQSIHDSSQKHIITELTRAAREAASGREIIVIGENEPQLTDLVRPSEKGGYGLDALWNDDFHHSAMVALTGRRQAYYTDHAGAPQEFISSAKYGYLFQGQIYSWQGKRRGTPGLDIPPAHFVNFVQNHDQIANSGRGRRFHQRTSPGRARAMTALMLLLPGTPMLFQGQEFWASTPFLYFADHKPELGRLVRKGREEFLSQFPNIASEEMSEHLADPRSPETFESCRLDWAEFDRNVEAVALHRDLLKLRRDHSAFARQRPGALDGAVLGSEAFVLRFFGDAGDDRLLLVNLGLDLDLRSIPDPLVAPPEDRLWYVLWSSEHPSYGGSGTPPIETESGWHLPGHAAVVMAAQRFEKGDDAGT